MMGRCSILEELGTRPSTPLMNRKYGSPEKYKRLVPQRRSDIMESSKQCGEYNDSEPRKYIEAKKEKVKFLAELPMESEMVEARREPVLNKRKRVTGSGHNFKSKLAKRTKGTVPEKSRVSQAEKFPSHQETEEQVQSGNPKKQWPKLKVIFPQGPRNATVINQETYNDDEWLDHCPLVERLACMKNKKASAKEEGYENQTLLKRKQTSKDNDRKKSSRAKHCAKEINSPKKQVVKETGTWNEIGKDSARTEGFESRILSKKNQVSKDEGAGNEIGEDCARTECFGNQTLLMKKQAMKDRGSGNEIINDSAREERYEKQPSQKKQALKDYNLGTEIVKDSSSEKHYENQTLTKTTTEVNDKGEGNDTGQDSSGEEHHENRIHIHSKKKQAAKHQCTGDEIEKDSVGGEGHQENCITSEEKQGVKDKGARKEIEKDSSKEQCENHILLQKKQAVKDKVVGSTIDSLIDILQKKCDKRMRKIIKKEKQEVQELDQIWEVKISEQEMDRKLELAIIRCFHKENPARIADKIKLLDGKFAKKMEEFNRLKDVQLKDLEVNHLAARNEERKKQARWLARAKPCQSSELKGVCGPESFGSQSENVCGFSQPSTQDVVPLTMHNMEDKNPCKSVLRDDVTMSEDSVSTDLQIDVPARLDLSDNSSNTGFDNGDQTGSSGALVNQRDETDETTNGLPSLGQKDELNKEVSPEVPETVPDIDYPNLVESSDNISNSRFGKEDGTCLPCALFNQRDGIDETSNSSLPLVGRRLGPAIVLSENEPVERNKEVPPEEPETVAIGILGYANPVELSSNTSDDKGIDEDAIGLPDALVSEGAETDETTTAGLPIAEQILGTLEVQASEYEIHQDLSSAVIQDQGAQVVEKQGTSLFEEDASEHIDNVEDQVTLQIEVANTEIVDSVNSLQDEGAQVEKQNSSDHVDSVTLFPSNLELSSNVSDKGIDLGDAIGFPDALANPGDETNEAAIGCLPLLEQLLESSEHPESQIRLMQVLEDAITEGLTSAVIEYHGAQVVEKQNFSLNKNAPVVEDQVTSLIEAANKEVNVVSPVQDEGAQVVEKQCISDNVDAVMTLPSNIEVQDQEPVEEEQFALQIEPGNCEPVDTVNPVQYDDALLTCNSDELQIEVENQSHNAERKCPLIAQMEETASVPQESSSQPESNGELLSNIEHLTSCHNTIDFLHQYGLQPGSLEHLYGPSYLFPDPNPQVASYAATFRMESERIHAETERLKKSHEDMVSQLWLDREKEIAQIDKKYKLKYQDAEAEFSSKKNRLEKNHKKVFQSKLLAEFLGHTCLGLCYIGLPGLPQAPVSSCMQHQPLQHLMSPPPVTTNPAEPAPGRLIAGWNMMRPTPVATFSGQPATSTPIPLPNFQSMQHQPLHHLTRPRSMATYPGQPAPGPPFPGPNLQAMQQLLLPSQNFAPSHIQTAQHAAAPGSFGSTSRPPVIGSFTPSVGNPHSGGGIHSMPLHLNSSRPTATFPPVTQHPPPLPAFQNMPQVQVGLTGQSNPLDTSVLQLLMDVEDLAQTPLVHWARLRQCSVQGNRITSVEPPDPICLSD